MAYRYLYHGVTEGIWIQCTRLSPVHSHESRRTAREADKMPLPGNKISCTHGPWSTRDFRQPNRLTFSLANGLLEQGYNNLITQLFQTLFFMMSNWLQSPAVLLRLDLHISNTKQNQMLAAAEVSSINPFRDMNVCTTFL